MVEGIGFKVLGGIYSRWSCGLCSGSVARFQKRFQTDCKESPSCVSSWTWPYQEEGGTGWLPSSP